MTAQLPIIFHPAYSFPLPAGHRFPMAKFAGIFHWLQQQEWWHHCHHLQPTSISDADLDRVHDPIFTRSLFSGAIDARAMRRIGLPWSETLIRRSRLAPGGTLLTAREALRTGLACHVAGGTHHARSDRGAGYCLLNDLAITAHALIADGSCQRILVLDCDVHQGDGTAVMCSNESRIVTCSLHGVSNYPLHKERSDIDVELARGTGDDVYLATLSDTLDLLQLEGFDLVLYDAGVDVHGADALGHLDLTTVGIQARDRMVIASARQAGVPVATVLGGGYDDVLEDLVARHSQVFAAAIETWTGSACA